MILFKTYIEGKNRERDAEKKKRKDPPAKRLGRRQKAASKWREAPFIFFVAGTRALFFPL